MQNGQEDLDGHGNSKVTMDIYVKVKDHKP